MTILRGPIQRCVGFDVFGVGAPPWGGHELKAKRLLKDSDDRHLLSVERNHSPHDGHVAIEFPFEQTMGQEEDIMLARVGQPTYYRARAG